MIKGEGFETVIASLPNYERLVAEIYYAGKFVALISQERACGVFEFETPGPGLDQREVMRTVELDGLWKAVEEGVARLKGAR